MMFSFLYRCQSAFSWRSVKAVIFSTFFIITILGLFSASLWACPNEYYTYTIEGQQLSYDFYGQKKLSLNFDKKKEFQKLLAIEDSFLKHKDYRYAADWASTMLKLGQYKDALEILVWLNRKFPDKYMVLANLGTAYELNGNLDSALKYIGKGYAINPNSHGGSEWIHLKVLEFQKQGTHDPNLLGLLNLSEKDQRDSAKMFQIRYQLLERMPFSPSPNEVVARLLIDYAGCLASQSSMEVAIAFLKMARDHYRYSHPGINQMISRYRKDISKYEHEFSRSGRVNPHKDTTLPFEFSYNWAGNLSYKDFYRTFAAYSPDWSKKKLTPSDIMASISPPIETSKMMQSSIDSTLNLDSVKPSQKNESITLVWLLMGGGIACTCLLLGFRYFSRGKSGK